MEEARVVVDAGPQVLVEQEPLGGRGEDPAGVGRAPLHPDVLHVGVQQLLTSTAQSLLLDAAVTASPES